MLFILQGSLIVEPDQLSVCGQSSYALYIIYTVYTVYTVCIDRKREKEQAWK